MPTIWNTSPGAWRHRCPGRDDNLGRIEWHERWSNNEQRDGHWVLPVTTDAGDEDAKADVRFCPACGERLEPPGPPLTPVPPTIVEFTIRQGSGGEWWVTVDYSSRNYERKQTRQSPTIEYTCQVLKEMAQEIKGVNA